MSNPDTLINFRHYQDVADDMRTKITSGEWGPNTMVPSRRALSLEYQVALTTVERAVAMLIAEGKLFADGRRGTYVASSSEITENISLYAIPSTPSLGKRRVERATVGIVASIYNYSIIENSDNQWPKQILHGCESTLSDEMEITHKFFNCANDDSLNDNQISDSLINFLNNESLDGIIIINQDDRFEKIMTNVDIERVPTVFVNSTPKPYSICQVYYDSAGAGYLATRHLLQRGYRNITYFAPFAYDWVTERQHGVEEAIKRVKAQNVSLNIYPSEQITGESVYDKTDITHEKTIELLSVIKENWGIVAANDNLAAEIMRITKDMNLVAGRDFGLIAFDDFTPSREMGITSLRPPLGAMGQTAARLMIDALKNETVPERVCLSSRLIPRASTMGYNLS
jgi:DNA-binding LacI/PurR family transcriptional regulator/DNA-binding transcriptional regulator YhcF (GntR family)